MPNPAHRRLRILIIPGRQAPNPYFSLLCNGLEQNGVQMVDPRSRDALLGNFDILHLNFPNHYIAEFGLLSAAFYAICILSILSLFRLFGKRIVYMVHDVEPLNKRNPRVLSVYTKLVNKLTSGFIFLSRSSEQEFLRLYPYARQEKRLRIAHGPYPVRLLSHAEKQTIRQKLVGETDSLIVGYIGAIKGYKNPGALSSIPKRLPDGREVHLLIAGAVEAPVASMMAQLLQSDLPTHTKMLRHLSGSEMDDLIQSVDIVFLPYITGFNSGLAILCLSNRARMIASDLPMFRELEQTLGHPWVYTWAPARSSSGRDLETLLESASKTLPTASDEGRLSDFLSESSFHVGSRAIVNFYRDLA